MTEEQLRYYDYDETLSKGEFLGYLEPRYDGRNSFYKKARVYKIDNQLILISYNTIVMNVYVRDGKSITAQLFGWYSQTTSRHLYDFWQQCELQCSDFPTCKFLKSISNNYCFTYVWSMSNLDRIIRNLRVK